MFMEFSAAGADGHAPGQAGQNLITGKAVGRP